MPKAKTVTKAVSKTKPSGKMPIINFRAKPATKIRLRVAASRLGLSQGELIRRFVATLPGSKGPVPKHVTVKF